MRRLQGGAGQDVSVQAGRPLPAEHADRTLRCVRGRHPGGHPDLADQAQARMGHEALVGPGARGQHRRTGRRHERPAACAQVMRAAAGCGWAAADAVRAARSDAARAGRRALVPRIFIGLLRAGGGWSSGRRHISRQVSGSGSQGTQHTSLSWGGQAWKPQDRAFVPFRFPEPCGDRGRSLSWGGQAGNPQDRASVPVLAAVRRSRPGPPAIRAAADPDGAGPASRETVDEDRGGSHPCA